MGVCISELEEGCCDYLESLDTTDGDSFTDASPTIDNILECNDKYLLIEEKSFLLHFFKQSCKGRKKYSSFINNGILEDEYFTFLATLTKEEKSKTFKDCSLNLLDAIPRKVVTTIAYLDDKVKVANSKNIILYCDSGTEIDQIASIIFARYNNEEENTVIECNKLERFLRQKGCV